MPQAGQVHAHAAQSLQLAAGPPGLSAPDCGDEMGQVMPEPVDQAAQFLGLFGLGRFGGWEVGACQDPRLVEQDVERST